MTYFYKQLLITLIHILISNALKIPKYDEHGYCNDFAELSNFEEDQKIECVYYILNMNQSICLTNPTLSMLKVAKELNIKDPSFTLKSPLWINDGCQNVISHVTFTFTNAGNSTLFDTRYVYQHLPKTNNMFQFSWTFQVNRKQNKLSNIFKRNENVSLASKAIGTSNVEIPFIYNKSKIVSNCTFNYSTLFPINFNNSLKYSFKKVSKDVCNKIKAIQASIKRCYVAECLEENVWDTCNLLESSEVFIISSVPQLNDSCDAFIGFEMHRINLNLNEIDVYAKIPSIDFKIDRNWFYPFT